RRRAEARTARSTSRTAVSAPLAGHVVPGDEPDRHLLLVALLRLEPHHRRRPQARGRGAEHAAPVESPVHARQLPGRSGGVLSAVLDPAAPDSLESRRGGELLPHADTRLAGRPLAVY